MNMYLDQLPAVFASIYTQAFGFTEVVGAAFDIILMTGIKRGMLSSEAGLGSALNAGASAAVTHPVKQGLLQTLGVHFDTFLISSIRAFIILVTGSSPASRSDSCATIAISGALGTTPCLRATACPTCAGSHAGKLSVTGAVPVVRRRTQGRVSAQQSLAS